MSQGIKQGWGRTVSGGPRDDFSPPRHPSRPSEPIHIIRSPSRRQKESILLPRRRYRPRFNIRPNNLPPNRQLHRAHRRVQALSLFLIAQVAQATQATGTAVLWTATGLTGLSAGFVTVLFFALWSDACGPRELGRIPGVAQGITVLASALGARSPTGPGGLTHPGASGPGGRDGSARDARGRGGTRDWRRCPSPPSRWTRASLDRLRRGGSG